MRHVHARLVSTALAALTLSLLPYAAAPQANPKDGEVPLPAESGWHASLMLDNAGTGVWAVRAWSLFAKYGCPQVVGLDDAGRCTILVSYSGKWTPWQTVHDGQWLGAAARGDLDGSDPAPELYAGGQRGRVYRIDPRPGGAVETRIAFELPGEEVHTLVAGDLDPTRDGEELLAFTRAGRVELATGGAGGLEHREILRLPGRVRNALVLPADDGPRIITVSRPGFVREWRLRGDALTGRVIHRVPMGLGRITRRAAPGPVVLYVTRDDGVVIRLEETADGWRAEDIYAGPLGLRGVASGRFHADPARESIAVFGYGAKVQLVSRAGDGPWRVETIFRDTDAGHDLIAVELDGRNATTELVGSGYSGRVFLLARPPGFGRDVATDPDPTSRPTKRVAATTAPVRITVAASSTPIAKLTTLDYGGGFETKTFLYETLIRRDARGRLAPGLAESWSADATTFRIRLRSDARFHDGTPVDANAVAAHIRRWLSNPAHRWIGASRRIQRVEVHSPRELTLHLDRPYALAPDLCATNPCGIVGPGAFDRDGDFVRPIGSGRFAFRSASADFDRLRYDGVDPRTGARSGRGIELVRIGHPPRVDPVALLRRGDVDVIVDSWLTQIPREHVDALRADTAFDFHAGVGSAVRYLAFNTETLSRPMRARVAAAIDRAALVDAVEAGHAVPCTTWVAPSVAVWPDSDGPTVRAGDAALGRPLRVLASTKFAADGPLARAVAAQLTAAGIPAEASVADRSGDYPARLGAGDYDVRVERTWGVPYDPFITLVARFGTPDEGVDPRLPPREGSAALTRLVDAMAAEPNDDARRAHFGAIQALVDRDVLAVPLYVPKRYAVVRKGFADVRLTHDPYRSDVIVGTAR